MKTHSKAMLAACVLAGSFTSARALGLPVANAGFEFPALAEGATTPFATSGTTSIPGWLIAGFAGGGGGVVNPEPGATSFAAGVPEGQNFGYAEAATVSQVLSTPLAAGRYTLSMSLGNPADRSDVADPARFELFMPGANRVILSSGAISLADIANGTFRQFTVTAVVAEDDLDIGGALELRILTGLPISVTGPYFAFDDVRLDLAPVPEPASWAMLVVGLLGLGSRRMGRISSKRRQSCAA